MTHAEQYEEEVFEDNYHDEDDRDERSDYERRWWDYSFYEDARFL